VDLLRPHGKHTKNTDKKPESSQVKYDGLGDRMDNYSGY